MFCPHCGNETELVIGAGPAAAETVNAEVEIARINAERDIAVAKITARQDRDWNETRLAVAEVETDATVAAAEVEAEIIAAVTSDPAPDPDPDPVVIDAPVAIADDVDDDAPPPADGSPVPEENRKSVGFGAW